MKIKKLDLGRDGGSKKISVLHNWNRQKVHPTYNILSVSKEWWTSIEWSRAKSKVKNVANWKQVIWLFIIFKILIKFDQWYFRYLLEFQMDRVNWK